MSRVGNQPVIIPSGVEVTLDPETGSGQTVTVKGPKGELSQTLNPTASVRIEEADGQMRLVVTPPENPDRNARAQWGTARALVANLVHGVTEGFSKTLEVNGVGFRVAVQGGKVVLNVGYSHPVEFQLPEGIDASAEDNLLTVSGIDKQQVGRVASELRSVRKPEPYKGKGIQYKEETIRRKAGKAQKAGE